MSKVFVMDRVYMTGADIERAGDFSNSVHLDNYPGEWWIKESPTIDWWGNIGAVWAIREPQIGGYGGGSVTPTEYAKLLEDECRFRRACRDPGFLCWNFLPDWAKLVVWLELVAVSAFYTAKGFGWTP